jgi:twitching motility protein PilT
MDYGSYLNQLLTLAVEEQASDLHITAEHPPVLRIERKLIPLVKVQKLTPQDTEQIAFLLMNEDQRNRFLIEKEIDFSYGFGGKSRFRINTFYQKGTVSIALRLVPERIKSVDELQLPPQIHTFCQQSQGFVIIAGPCSHGKSTTMASMIDEINHTRACRIITIEDPIEYIFNSDKAMIEQRELFQDTLSFPRALKSTFREDPDVVMLGEMRDPETISTAITAAETGHLVLATLHTNSAAQTIHRMVDSFPGSQQGQIRAQLSGSLLGIVSQRLIPSLRKGVVPACEVMFNVAAVSNLIRENKVHEIPLIIDTSLELGMKSLDRSLADLVREKKISLDNALSYSSNPEELRKLI